MLGGPVEAAFSPDRELEFGMTDIVANALGFDHSPAGNEIAPLAPQLSLRPLLDQDVNAPMLVINGADDIHVPHHDTLVFEGRRDTRVDLLAHTGHCAMSRLGEVMPVIAKWIDTRLRIAPQA